MPLILVDHEGPAISYSERRRKDRKSKRCAVHFDPRSSTRILAGSYLGTGEPVGCTHFSSEDTPTSRPQLWALKNAPFCFSRLMDIVLKGMHVFALPYLDGVGIFSDTWEKHIEHLRNVFSRLGGAGLAMKAEKRNFRCSHVCYLGRQRGDHRNLESLR